jgi:NAD(P)-dependent dehydrogenase (short-subunit alcohol dehydrogenase family)/acyl dehydratase/putative sterol carrier protein
MGLLDGKVVVITGAGGGIGRCHALAFAAEGAKVVVNDLGSSRDGSGQSHSMADQVVAEIRSAGGQATASYASVADAEGARSIIQTALDAFGRIDVLVNNAGILRDKSILKMDEAMWDLVVAVHLKGSFLLTKLAGERMKEQGGGGRIINTSSYAGLKGNFGQANYGAAKAGIYGLTVVAALEFAKFGVTVNAIAPMAKTRMTEDISQVPDEMKPEQISPMVLFLASDLAAGVTGRIFGIHGQQLFEYKMLMTEGVTKPGDARWTPQEIAAQLDTIGAEKKTTALAIRETLALVAPAAPQGPAPSKLEQVMMLLPKAFSPQKAGTWKANIHFETGTEGTYTILVENGACRVEKGGKGTPTARVKADADTLIGLFDGSVDGQKAFMAGKLKIDKIGDMMNFQKAFDRSALQAQAAAATPAKTAVAASAPPQAAAQNPIERAFSLLGPAFRPEKAAGWEANLHFLIQGADNYTVRVTGGSCAVQKGLMGKPTSAVKTDAETLVGLFNGTVDGQKAFMARKIVVDNIGDMMKFARAFDFKAAQPQEPAPAPAAPKARASDESVAAKAAEVAAAQQAAEGVNHAWVGRFFPGEVSLASAEEMKAYAEAVGDRNPVYLDEERAGGIVGHPIFPVRYFHETMMPAVTDPELRMDLLRLVHGEQEMSFFLPLRPKDLIFPTARLLSIEDKSSGQLVRFQQTLLCEGRPVAEAITGIFIRGRKKDGAKKEEEAKAERRAPDFTVSRRVDEDQPKRYAAASGDSNPIHLDPDVARAAGLPGVILHGLCTMAIATQAVVDQACGGDPGRLRRIAVRFAKPVFPGSTIETRLWVSQGEGGGQIVEFETYDQEGRCVLERGRAEVSV